MTTLPSPTLFADTLQWMARLASLAAAVNALELLAISSVFSANGTWHGRALADEWGGIGKLRSPRAFRGVQSLQLLAAFGLALASGTTTGAACAAVLCCTTLLAALRFRGTVNGGSDGMLFTVLGGLALAQLPVLPAVVREGAVLYVAAQLTLSYLRAGLVKVRERSWWTGDAMAAFLALPAYGVPAWVPRQRALLRAGGVGVMAFECLAPACWFFPGTTVAVLTVAVCFHAVTALLFGLNRFLLAWGAAMPALWYATHRGVGL
jgi:hypothetical protein